MWSSNNEICNAVYMKMKIIICNEKRNENKWHEKANNNEICNNNNNENSNNVFHILYIIIIT
jgi:hypothetical protein